MDLCFICQKSFVRTRGARQKTCGHKECSYQLRIRRNLRWREDHRAAYNEAVKERRNSDRVKVSAENRRNGLARYGLTLEQYEALVQKQDGKCVVCKIVPKRNKRGDVALGVDHCHETAFVRGLLCSQCNTSLGLMKEDPQLIQALAEYARLAVIIRSFGKTSA